MNGHFHFLLACNLLLTLCGTTFAQNAQVLGRVTDPQKAVVPNACIRVVNQATGVERRTISNEEGFFSVQFLLPSHYRIYAQAHGFETAVSQDLQLAVGQTLAFNIQLKVGGMTQAIDVNEEPRMINTTDPTTGSTMSNRQVTELPINGRDYARFSLLVPGAVARSNYIADLSFNGLHTVHNQYSIDGIDASRVDQPYMANGYERGSRLLTGSLDSISEFRVQSSDYEVQYGRAAGSVISIVSKSGTNHAHGTLFEFFRNDILDARNFFAVQKPPLRFNNFGGNVSGPIRKDKTFYFVNYEGSRQRIGIVGTGTVPSRLLRSLVLTTSPYLAPIVNAMPLGTSSTANPLVDNYTVVKVSDIREDTASIRIDNVFGRKDSAFVRLNVNDSHVYGPLFGVYPSVLGVNDFQNVPIRTTNVAIHEIHVFSSTLVNELLTGTQRWGSQLMSDESIPQTTITGLTIVPGTRGRILENATSFQWGDNLSKTIGRHALKWGGAIYRVQVNRRSINLSTMTFASLSDFINNRVATATITVGDPGHGTRATQIGAFVQDMFQCRPNFTVDYGLRYDYETVPHDTFFATQTFDTRTNTLAPPGSSYFRANKRDFAPRLGVAWSPASNWIVRSGYGIFWQVYPVGFGSYNVPLNNIPGNMSFLRQQIPNLSYPLGPFISQGSHPLPNVAGFDYIRRDIYTQQWNLSVGRQLGADTTIQVAYVGNHGLDLRRNLNINFFDPTLGRRPNPDYGDINIEGNTGQSVYHSLQISFKRRSSSGLEFDAEYTYSHTIDDVQDQGLWSAQPQDNNNLKAERGNGSGDIRHNVAFSALYELPMGQGHHFLGSASGFAGKMVSGWKMAVLGLLHTGIADTVYIGTNTYGNGNYTNQRPNAVAGVNPYPANQTVDNWLNPAAFSMPASGTFGNLGRNTIVGPGFKQIDLSMMKETKIGEAGDLEFRAEFFDVFNHPNFAQPNTIFGTSSFGRIFSTLGSTIGMGTSRQIQVALKFTF
jgi:hypothetical protein